MGPAAVDGMLTSASFTGACEGTLACSTCHLIFEDHIYEKLDAITDEENDMLDLAFGLTNRWVDVVGLLFEGQDYNY